MKKTLKSMVPSVWGRLLLLPIIVPSMIIVAMIAASLFSIGEKDKGDKFFEKFANFIEGE